MATSRVFDRERESVDRGAMLPETAAGFATGDRMGTARLRERRLWDEGGQGSEVEQAPGWLSDGWGVLSGSSAEWDKLEAVRRPFDAGFLDAMRGTARRSADRLYAVGYDTYIRGG